MYNYKIKFTKKPEAPELSDDDIFELVDAYFSALLNNGQVIGGYDVFSSGGFVYATFVMPTEDALSGIYDNEYVKKYLAELNAVFDMEFIREGENLEYEEPCECAKPSWFFLQTEHFTNSSPLNCGECDCRIPLYKVPHILGEKEHFSVKCWQSSHKNLHQLWIEGLWDKFAYREISTHNSKLARKGRKICKEFEKALGVPVYYYLYYFNGIECDDFVPRGKNMQGI